MSSVSTSQPLDRTSAEWLHEAFKREPETMIEEDDQSSLSTQCIVAETSKEIFVFRRRRYPEEHQVAVIDRTSKEVISETTFAVKFLNFDENVGDISLFIPLGRDSDTALYRYDRTTKTALTSINPFKATKEQEEKAGRTLDPKEFMLTRIIPTQGDQCITVAAPGILSRWNMRTGTILQHARIAEKGERIYGASKVNDMLGVRVEKDKKNCLKWISAQDFTVKHSLAWEDREWAYLTANDSMWYVKSRGSIKAHSLQADANSTWKHRLVWTKEFSANSKNRDNAQQDFESARINNDWILIPTKSRATTASGLDPCHGFEILNAKKGTFVLKHDIPNATEDRVTFTESNLRLNNKSVSWAINGKIHSVHLPSGKEAPPLDWGVRLKQSQENDKEMLYLCEYESGVSKRTILSISPDNPPADCCRERTWCCLTTTILAILSIIAGIFYCCSKRSKP